MQNGQVKFLVVNPEEYRLIVHALISVTPTGGGSPLNSTVMKLLKQHDLEIDHNLLSKMAGRVVKELYEYLELPVPEEVKKQVTLCHPYDIK
jgi:hypothetical protein